MLFALSLTSIVPPSIKSSSLWSANVINVSKFPINSGEGGFIASRDAGLMARATLLSGSYMLYGRHETAPAQKVFEDFRLHTPNCSGRMDNLRAAILRPQLAMLDENVSHWNERYRTVHRILKRAPNIFLCERPEKEHFVGSSILFSVDALSVEGVGRFIDGCLESGVELKWFGDSVPSAYTSRYDSWRYLQSQSLPRTDTILSRLFDMRIPLSFSIADCELIGNIIIECLSGILNLGTNVTSRAATSDR